MPPTDEALLLAVLRWSRANGWRLTDRTQAFETSDVTYTWTHPLLPRVKVWLDAQAITLEWKHNIVDVTTVAAAVNQLAVLELIPPEMAPLYRAGGDSVTVASLSNLLHLQLYQLEQAPAKNVLAAWLADLLPADPFDARKAVDRIVDAVAEVLHA